MKRALALSCLLLLSACGGGDDDAGSGLSKAEYLTKAEAICKQAAVEVKAEPFPSTPKAFPGYAAKLIEVAERVRAEVAALDPPEADEKDLSTKVLEPLDKKLQEGRVYQKALQTAVDKNDTKRLGELVGGPATKTKPDLAWMRSYGFKECVEVADAF
jgi:hypothetical protein